MSMSTTDEKLGLYGCDPGQCLYHQYPLDDGVLSSGSRDTSSKEASSACTVSHDNISSPSSVVDRYLASDAALKLRYTPVHEWQTRLLCLKPGTDQDLLSFELRVVDLAHVEGAVLHDCGSIVEYAAISYAWDSPGPMRLVHCDGHIHSASKTVCHALRAVREPDKETHVWLDALCINQDDVMERSSHIRRMFLIYRKAKEVFVWLGDAGPHTDLAIEALNETESIHLFESTCRRHLSNIHKGLLDLCARPWLERTWVRQEVFAARGIYVLCGDTSAPWEGFKNSGIIIRKSAERLASFGLTAQSLTEIKRHLLGSFNVANPEEVARILVQECGDSRYSGHGAPSKTDLLDVLVRSCYSQVSNDRDRVYGVLGMTTTRTKIQSDNITEYDGAPILIVDYGRSLSQVFQDATMYLLNRDRSLHTLYVSGSFGSSGDLSLPSWCPDWRFPIRYTPFIEIEQSLATGFGFDKWIRPALSVTKHLHHTSTHLHLRGISIAIVVSTSSTKLTGLRGHRDTDYHPYCYHKIFNNLRLQEAVRQESKRVHLQMTIELLARFREINEQQGERTGRCREASETWLKRFAEGFWWAPKSASSSDLIVFMRGGMLPLVLRPRPSGYFQYLGPALLCWGPLLAAPGMRADRVAEHLYHDFLVILGLHQENLQEFIIV